MTISAKVRLISRSLKKNRGLFLNFPKLIVRLNQPVCPKSKRLKIFWCKKTNYKKSFTPEINHCYQAFP